MHIEYLDPYTLSWPDGVFPLTTDSLALSRFATVRKNWNICDLGCGSGTLLLLLHGREPSLSLSGIEIHPLSAQTAMENLKQNGLSGAILNEDLRTSTLSPASFDLIISNPPYFPLHGGPSGGKARSEETCTLDELCASAARLLRNGGRFALCHRPERLTDLLVTLRTYHLEPKRMKLLSHSPNHPPFLVLLESIRQGKPGLEIILSNI